MAKLDVYEEIPCTARIDLSQIEIPAYALPHLLAEFSGQDIANAIRDYLPDLAGDLVANLPSELLERGLRLHQDGTEICRKIEAERIKKKHGGDDYLLPLRGHVVNATIGELSRAIFEREDAGEVADFVKDMVDGWELAKSASESVKGVA